MRQPFLFSFFISILLHGGIITAALFWPVSAKPPIDLAAPVIDIGIYTIGAPGKAPEQIPSSPGASERPQLPAPQTPPQTPPKAPETPETPKAVPEPEVPAVPIPQPDAPEEPKKPREAEKPAEPPKPVPEKPKEPETPKTPPKPKPNPSDVLQGALGDLSKGRQSSSIADALGDLQKAGGESAEGSGPGGSGGDGIGIRGSYMQSLVSRIKPNWEYAGRADRKNPTAVVAISIAPDGSITEAEIITSSGDAAFDGSVLKAIYDTGRVEPPPTPAFSKVRVPFAYEAIRR